MELQPISLSESYSTVRRGVIALVKILLVQGEDLSLAIMLSIIINQNDVQHAIFQCLTSLHLSILFTVEFAAIFLIRMRILSVKFYLFVWWHLMSYKMFSPHSCYWNLTALQRETCKAILVSLCNQRRIMHESEWSILFKLEAVKSSVEGNVYLLVALQYVV